MKKIIAIGLALSLGAGMLAGCGVAEARSGFPTQQAATSQQAAQPIASAQPSAPALPSLQDQVGAPAAYSGEFTENDGKLVCTLDAWVELPDVDTLPTLEIEAAPFSQEQVTGMLTYLFGDTPLYDVPTQLTKEEVQMCLNSAQRNLEELQNPQKDTFNFSNEEEVRQYIADMEAQLETAPETVEPELSSGKLRTIRPSAIGFYPEEYEGLNVTGDLGKPTPASFSVNNKQGLVQTGKSYSSFQSEDGPVALVFDSYTCGADLYYANDGDRQAFFDLLPDGDYAGFFDQTPIPVQNGQPQQDSADGISLTPQQALAQAQEFFAAAGAEMSLYSMKLTTVNPDNMSKEAYEAADGYTSYDMSFVRDTGGVNSLFIDGAAMDPSPGDPAYMAGDTNRWTYESCNVSVDDTGIVGIEWHSPLAVRSTPPQEQALLPFSDIMDVFRTLLAQDRKRETSPPEVESLTFHVNHIALGYFRLSGEGSITEGTLVPAWGFYGYGQRNYTDSDPSVFPDGASPYMLINAVTGEMIDECDLRVG